MMILFWYDHLLRGLDDTTNRVMIKNVSMVITVHLQDIVSVVK